MRKFIYFFALLCLLYGFCTSAIKWPRYPFTNVHQQSRKVEHVDKFLKLRSGGQYDPAIWYHHGVIRNPLTGTVVVGIEGIEMTRLLNPSEEVSTNESGLEENRDGRASSRPISTDKQAPFTRSYITKKMFAYVDINNRSTLMDEYRVRAGSPRRKVSPVKIMAEQVTLSLDAMGRICARITWPGGRNIWSHKLSIVESASSSSFASIDKLLGISQYEVTAFVGSNRRKPVRKWISFGPSQHGSGSGHSQEYYSIRRSSVLPISLSAVPIFLQLALRGKSMRSMINMRARSGTKAHSMAGSSSSATASSSISSSPNSSPSSSGGQNDSDGPIASDRKGDRITRVSKDSTQQASAVAADAHIATSRVSLGSSGGLLRRQQEQEVQEQQHRWGGMVQPQVVMEYKRYGEAPPWYAVGRHCVTEIRALRYPSATCLPPHAKKLFEQIDPDFLRTTGHIASSSTSAGATSARYSSNIRKDLRKAKGGRGGGGGGAERLRSQPLSLEWFNTQRDLLDNYPPWYKRIPSPVSIAIGSLLCTSTGRRSPK